MGEETWKGQGRSVRGIWARRQEAKLGGKEHKL